MTNEQLLNCIDYLIDTWIDDWYPEATVGLLCRGFTREELEKLPAIRKCRYEERDWETLLQMQHEEEKEE